MSHEEIDHHEGLLREAMLAGDAGALDDLLADDLVFTDHRGRVLTKADDLAAHCSGLLRLDEIRVEDRAVRLLPAVGVVTLRARLTGAYDGVAFAGDFRYTRVWSEAGGRPQVVAAHCSAVA